MSRLVMAGVLFALVVGATLITARRNKPAAPKAGALPAAVPDPRGEALRVCAVFKDTGMAEACEYRGTNVRVHMRTTRSEATTICAATVASVAPYTRSLAGGCQLQIVSPADDDRPLAVCAFK
jgi:hypothetical protein